MVKILYLVILDENNLKDLKNLESALENALKNSTLYLKKDVLCLKNPKEALNDKDHPLRNVAFVALYLKEHSKKALECIEDPKKTLEGYLENALHALQSKSENVKSLENILKNNIDRKLNLDKQKSSNSLNILEDDILKRDLENALEDDSNGKLHNIGSEHVDKELNFNILEDAVDKKLKLGENKYVTKLRHSLNLVIYNLPYEFNENVNKQEAQTVFNMAIILSNYYISEYIY